MAMGNKSSTTANGSKDIVLLGDSTLDNVVWVSDYEGCVAAKLRKNGRKVYNFAADGFNSKNMLQDPPTFTDFDRYSKLGFKPLEEAKKVPNSKEAICVLSFGGNDIRENLGGIAHGKDPKEVLTQTLQNYFKVLDILLPHYKQIMICTQYMPDEQNDVYRIYEVIQVEGVRQLMQFIYPPLFEFAKKHNIAILDFANSFNSKDGRLYECQIEPSSLGGDIIATLINYAAKHHTFEKSAIYSIKDQKVVVSENNGDWNVSISDS